MSIARLQAFGVGALLAGLVTACASDVDRTEVVRLASPDGAVEGVAVETGGGATAPFGYLIHVVRPGCAVDGPPVLRVVGATRNDAGAAGVKLQWTGPRELAVRYRDARFSDPAGPALVTPPGASPVAVRPEPGVSDPAAPPGAMARAGSRPAPPGRDC